MKEYADKMLKEWKDWGGQAPKEFGTGPMQTNAKKPSNSGKETDGWHWEHAYRIDVKTNFDENWYKRKFKSGILNGIINVIKTDAMSRSTGAASGKTEMSGHKYTADEMLPGDKRKLDGLQWKMTNKVAKDYITFLLGWSRKKEKFIDEKTEQPRPKQENLGVDQAFGKSMADKALSNRGILGRLKQKLFSGGQSNNVVSVAFQMADPEDGWKLVDEKTGKEIETGEVGAEGGDAGAEGGGRGSGSSSSSGGETGSGSGDGKGNGGGTGSSGEELSGDKDMNKLLTLLQRVERLEDTVGVGPGSKGSKNVDESSDPFFGVFDELDMPRRRLVKEACGLNCSSVNALVDDVMFGKGDE